MRDHRRPRTAAIPIGALALALALTTAGTAAADPLEPGDERPAPPPPSLPAPTGDLAVGTTTLHLVDDTREDPWLGGDRELMVTLWYPTPENTGERAPYMTRAEAEATLAALGIEGLPPETLTDVGTHAVPEAPPVTVDGGLPLVLYSPGSGVSRVWATGLAEELASQGFAVAGIDHRNEASPVEFPDGLVEECAGCLSQEWESGALTRSADVSFLLDSFERGAAREWAPILDTDRVGMIGHSWGGAAVAQSLLDEERVAAGLNLDGPYYTAQLEGEIDRPLALLANDQGRPWEGWDERWAGQTGWRQWIRITGSGHSNVLDKGVFMDELGLRDLLAPEQWRAQFGDLDPARGVSLIREYSTALFAHHLRGEERPLLEDPEAVHPELVVVASGTPAP